MGNHAFSIALCDDLSLFTLKFGMLIMSKTGSHIGLIKRAS